MTKLEKLEGIIEKYSPLVRSIASKFNYQDKEDLYQVGIIGLINAYKNFKPGMNSKFSTYAHFYISGEIKKYVREDKGIKIARDLTRLAYKLEEVKNYLTQKFMHTPSSLELSRYLEIDEDKVIEALALNVKPLSLDNPINEDVSLHEIIPNSKTLDLDGLIDLREALNTLKPLEQQVIHERYMNDRTQTNTAKKLHLTQVQVCRCEQKILNELKHNLVH